MVKSVHFHQHHSCVSKDIRLDATEKTNHTSTKTNFYFMSKLETCIILHTRKLTKKTFIIVKDA